MAAQHSVLHRLPCSHRVTRASLLTMIVSCHTRTTLFRCGGLQGKKQQLDKTGRLLARQCLVVGRMKAALRQNVCITGHAINHAFNQSFGMGAGQHNHSLSQVTHYLVLGDGLILARVPFSACLGVELLNFLDQDVLALSSSPNCAQPPSHQKRDRVKIARLCLQSSAASFSTRANQNTSESIRYCTQWRDSAGHHPYPPQC